jgi:hypothetical protein
MPSARRAGRATAEEPLPDDVTDGEPSSSRWWADQRGHSVVEHPGPLRSAHHGDEEAVGGTPSGARRVRSALAVDVEHGLAHRGTGDGGPRQRRVREGDGARRGPRAATGSPARGAGRS